MGLKVWNCGFDTLSQEIYKSSKCFNDIFAIIVIAFCTIISHDTLNNLWYYFHRSRCVWRTSKRWVHLRAGASLKNFGLRARLCFRFGAWAIAWILPNCTLSQSGFENTHSIVTWVFDNKSIFVILHVKPNSTFHKSSRDLVQLRPG